MNYDVGRVLDGMNWHPAFDPAETRRELEIIQNDLHCNAVKICGQDTGRLVTTAQGALRQGLEVWLSPELWDEDQDETLRYLTQAAREAESLHRRWPGRVVLSVGTGLTLFTPGFLEGAKFQELGTTSTWPATACEERRQPARRAFRRHPGHRRDAVARWPAGTAYPDMPWEPKHRNGLSGPAGRLRPTIPACLTCGCGNSSRLYTPSSGLAEAVLRASSDPACMVAFWLVGFEEESPGCSGEICVAELFGHAITPQHCRVRIGVKAHNDPRLHDEMLDVAFGFDATGWHTYSAQWTAEHVRFFVDDQLVRTIHQRIDYPLQFMVDLFEFPRGSDRDPAA